MQERRHNWKEGLGKEARARAEKRQSLLIELEQIREAIQSCGLNFSQYDDLKQQQREKAAELATL